MHFCPLNSGVRRDTEIKDTMPYVRVMEEIKRRVFVIGACLDDKTLLTGPPRVETAALQLRMVTELIALASLAANKELFEQQSMRFESHWHPQAIIKDLEKINPNFYPRPVKAGSSDSAGVVGHEPLKDGYLTRDGLVEIHGRCGNILHARNPFGKPIDYDAYATDITAWTNLAVGLLNTHEIRLLGDDHFYLVNMTEPGRDAVFMYTFERVGGTYLFIQGEQPSYRCLSP